MLFRAVSTVVVAALAGQAMAEPVSKPYKLPLAKMSVKEIFGLSRRDDTGYQPTQTLCGTGTTCAEACGTGFEQCASKDNQIHCFDPTAKQTCCPGDTGDSCDDGYYCSADNKGGVWCCPNGMSLDECAKQYSVTGGLSSDTPTATPSLSSATVDLPLTSSVFATSSSVLSSAVSIVSNAPAALTNSSSAECTTYTVSTVVPVLPTPNVSPNATYVPPVTTLLPTSATTTATAIVTAAASKQGPVAMFVLGAIAIVGLF